MRLSRNEEVVFEESSYSGCHAIEGESMAKAKSGDREKMTKAVRVAQSATSLRARRIDLPRFGERKA